MCLVTHRQSSLVYEWQMKITTKVYFKDGPVDDVIFHDYYKFKQEVGATIDYTYDEFKDWLMVENL